MNSSKNTSEPSITALLGAGAFLDVGGKSTLFLTQKTMEIKAKIHNNIFCNHSEPYLENLADKLNKYWEKGKSNDKCNFEDIYHTIEMLYSYRRYGKGKAFRPPLGAFINRCDYFFKYEYLKSSLKDVINVIGENVKEYDSKFQPDGAHKWFADFWRNATSIKKWNIATLNYDTCIEKCLEKFEDGFDNAETEIGGHYHNQAGNLIEYYCQQYSPTRIRESDCSKIMHLHGSILYGYPIRKRTQFFEHDNNDLYKFKNYCEALRSWVNMPFMPKQGLETTISGPIVTGLGKTDKLLCYPYIDYNNLLYESLYNNKCLFVAGYSFGDVYINKMLDKFAYLNRPKKVVIVTQAQKGDFKWTGELTGIEEFILKLTKDVKPFCYNSLLPSPAKSTDGSVLLCIDGMKDALVNHRDEILNFLTS